jgi:hypothetical protein
MEKFCKDMNCPIYKRFMGRWDFEEDRKVYKKNACETCMAVKYNNWVEDGWKKLKEEARAKSKVVYDEIC